MNRRQQELETGHRPRSRPQLEIEDFVGVLPPNVMPSGARILERDGSLLIVRHYAYGEFVPKAHLKIWRTLVKMGNHPDAPGSVSVMCVWGIQATPASRGLKVIDWTGETDVMVATNDSIRAAISAWWAGAKR